MDALFHFVFPLIAIAAAGVRIKHYKVPTILTIALAAVLIDIDHFFGLVPSGTFHNMFFTFLIPLAIVVLAFKYGYERHRQISLAFLIVMVSHVILDMFSEGAVYLLYPFSMQPFSLAAFYITTVEGYYLVSSSSIGLLIFFGMLAGIFFIEDIDFFILKKHLRFRYALKYALRKEEKKLLN